MKNNKNEAMDSEWNIEVNLLREIQFLLFEANKGNSSGMLCEACDSIKGLAILR